MVLIVGITLLLQNHILFFITLASIPFYLVTILAFVKSYEKANQEEMNAGAILNSSMIESLKGIETIKAYNGEKQVYQKVDKEFIKLMKKSFKTVTLDNVQQGLKHGIQLINSALILWAGSYYVMNGTICLGQLITLLTISVWLLDTLLPSQYQITDNMENKSVFLPNSIRYSYWLEIIIQIIIICFLTWII